MNLTRQNMEQVVRAWNAAGLPARTIEPLEQGIADLQRIASEHRALIESVDVADVADRLAEGSITFREAVVEHAAITSAQQAVSASNPTARASVLLASARRRIAQRVTRYMRSQTREIVGLISSRHEDLIARAAKLSLEGVVSADQAVKAGGKTAVAWSQLVDLETQRDGLLRLRDLLVGNDFIDRDALDQAVLKQPLLQAVSARDKATDLVEAGAGSLSSGQGSR